MTAVRYRGCFPGFARCYKIVEIKLTGIADLELPDSWFRVNWLLTGIVETGSATLATGAATSSSGRVENLVRWPS